MSKHVDGLQQIVPVANQLLNATLGSFRTESENQVEVKTKLVMLKQTWSTPPSLTDSMGQDRTG